MEIFATHKNAAHKALNKPLRGTAAKMYYIPIYLKCGIYVGYFSFYDFMWDTCGIDIFIVRICMWDKCGIGEKVKVF